MNPFGQNLWKYSTRRSVHRRVVPFHFNSESFQNVQHSIDWMPRLVVVEGNSLLHEACFENGSTE